MAAVSAELGAIVLHKMCKILNFCVAEQDAKFCALWPILRKILCARRIAEF